ncbi:hypothetical protein PG985_003722 [Apiospora marii]|uniref:uncharacterized protein n=1 Tax=Apiospora marii TaxID=335849 RepID=UPI0031309DE7
MAKQAAERRRETFDHDDDPLNEELTPDNDKPSFDKPPPPPPVPEEPVSSEFTSSPSQPSLEDPFVESPVFPNLATKGNPITDFSVDLVGQEAGESQGSGKGESPPPVTTPSPPAPSNDADSERTASPEIDPNTAFLDLVGTPPTLPPRWVEAVQGFLGSLPRSLPKMWGSSGSRPSTPDSESPPTPPRMPNETDPLLGNKQEPRRPLNEAEERERLLAEFAQHIGSYSDYLARFEDSISETSVAYVPGQGWTDREGLLTWQTKGQWPPTPLPHPAAVGVPGGRRAYAGLLVITALVIFAMLSGKTLPGLPKFSRLEFPVWQASAPQATTYASLPLPELNVTSSASFSQTVSQPVPTPEPEPTPTSSSTSDDPSSSSSSSSSQTVSQPPPQTTEAPSPPPDGEASSGEPTERHTTTKWRQMYYVYVPDREVTTL